MPQKKDELFKNAAAEEWSPEPKERHIPSLKEDSDSDGPSEGFPPTLMLLAILVLLLVGYFLCMKLVQMSQTEDCLMAGRHNCAEIGNTF
jgi:hypothetical protein